MADLDNRMSVGVDSRLDDNEFLSMRPMLDVSVFVTRPAAGGGDNDDDDW